MSKSITFETPAGYNLDSEDYYENRTIKAGRSDKMCIYCGKTIPKGQPHTVHKFCPDGEYMDYPTHNMNPKHGDNLAKGEKSCTQKLMEGLDLPNHHYY